MALYESVIIGRQDLTPSQFETITDEFISIIESFLIFKPLLFIWLPSTKTWPAIIIAWALDLESAKFLSTKILTPIKNKINLKKNKLASSDNIIL